MFGIQIFAVVHPWKQPPLGLRVTRLNERNKEAVLFEISQERSLQKHMEPSLYLENITKRAACGCIIWPGIILAFADTTISAKVSKQLDTKSNNTGVIRRKMAERLRRAIGQMVGKSSRPTVLGFKGIQFPSVHTKKIEIYQTGCAGYLSPIIEFSMFKEVLYKNALSVSIWPDLSFSSSGWLFHTRFPVSRLKPYFPHCFDVIICLTVNFIQRNSFFATLICMLGADWELVRFAPSIRGN